MKYKYLQQYPANILQQVDQLIVQDKLGPMLKKKYPNFHQVRTSKALYQYTNELKNRYMRKAAALDKVEYSDKAPAYNALGVHKRISKSHGGKLKARKEIYIDKSFIEYPEPFLRMIVVHELAHLKEMDHNKAFYNLCCHMEPDYHQLEFDLRLYLTWLDMEKAA